MSKAHRRPKLVVTIGTIKQMGGAERQALYLVEFLASLSRCSVEVLTFEDGAALRPALLKLGVPVHVFRYYFRWPRVKRARALAELGAMLRFRVKPDALLPFVGIHSKTIGMVSPYSGSRFWWWNQQDEGRDLTGTRVEKRILRRAPSITSNSFAGRDFLVETYGIDPSRVLVYNNGTPLRASGAPDAAWRRRFGIGDRPAAAMVANVTSFKDHRTLIDAWPLVQERFAPDRRPVLVLAGHLREQDTAAALKIRAFERGLSAGDVRFIGPVDDIQSLFDNVDIVVHSSTLEGCPNAVCEAMAASKAVVATDIPGCRQALGERGLRWLAPPHDPVALAERVVGLLSDAALRNEVGAENRERIEREFSIDGMNSFFRGTIERGLGEPLE